MKIDKASRRMMAQENARQSDRLTPVPAELWPNYLDRERMPYAVWRSKRYLVQGFAEAANTTRLSINRTTVRADGKWDDTISWDELMEIKRQVGLGDYFAIEILPRDADVVNVANMRHIWVFREPMEIGWRRS